MCIWLLIIYLHMALEVYEIFIVKDVIVVWDNAVGKTDSQIFNIYVTGWISWSEDLLLSIFIPLAFYAECACF